MKRSRLVIPEPCAADWEAMHGDDRRRFCDLCTKHVHNISELTEARALELLGSSNNLCIQYAFDRSGEVMFADTKAPHWRLHRQVQGAKRLLAAAAIALPLFACEAPSPPVEPTATSPIVLDGDSAAIDSDGGSAASDSSKPGAAVRSGFTAPSNTPPSDPSFEFERGEPAEFVVGKLAREHEDETSAPEGDVAHEVEPHGEDNAGCGSDSLTDDAREATAPSP